MRESKRQAVLRASARVLRRRGYEGTNFTDIAAELHVSKPTIYYYFRNKQEILRELLDVAIGSFIDPADRPEDYPCLSSLTGVEQMERFLRRALRIVLDDVGSCLQIVPSSVYDAETRVHYNRSGIPVLKMLGEILSNGLRDGSIVKCDVVMTYHFIIGALIRIPIWYEDHPVPMETLSAAIIRFVIDGLRTHRATTAG